MKRIGLMSDTHGHLPEQVFKHFAGVDEIWHAGDVGDASLIKTLSDFKPLRGVFGNIDGQEVRSYFPELNVFDCEGVKVMMRHIGGHPNRYAPGVKDLLRQHQPALFIAGHSHLLKVQYDATFQCLHMNPGACGKQGWHKVNTLLRFVVDGKEMKGLEVVEWERG